MHQVSKKISETVQLADRLVEDIRHRNLRPGDAYFTTKDARQFLGVGGTEANRALQLLEKRQIIKRAQRRGSVILSPPQSMQSSISRIHIFVPELYYTTEGFGGDGILFGIQGEFPLAAVSHYLLPNEKEIERTQRLVDQAIANGGTDAFVLASVPYEVQRAIARTAFPAVIYGTAYQGIGHLPQLERAHPEGAEKLIRHFQKRGAKKIAVLMRQHLMPGDNRAFDVILSILGGSSPIRFLALDHEHIVAVVRDILRTDPSVDAFLCHSVTHAEAVADALRIEGRSFDEVAIGILVSFARRNDPPKFTHIRLVPTPEEIGQKLADMLRRRLGGLEVDNEIVPVELVVV